MCKFMSSLSKYSPSVGVLKRNPNLEMFLQPCKDEKTYYRVRLLGFESKLGRSDPHIVRYVHKVWVTDPKTGKKHQEKILCSKRTAWFDTEGPKTSSCKICNYVNQQWSIYNESGKTDIEARTKASKLSANYEAIVPVYVKNDPNYERNNGKFKVIIFNNKETYEDFRKLIEHKLKEVSVLNSVKAVDTLIHVGVEEITTKAGKIYKNPVIDKIKFSTEPYDIPAINSKNIDAFPFDDTYYVKPDQDEIDEFYNKYCSISNDDIPEDDDIPIYASDKSSNSSNASNVKIPENDIPTDDVSDDEIDDLISNDKDEVDVKNDLTTDPDDEGLAVIKSSSNESDDIDSDDILKELGI